MTCTVGEMAQRMELSTSTLRYYEKEGLLPTVNRTDGGQRLYQEEDEQRLRIIACLKKTGMSIRDIRSFMDWCAQGDETIPQRKQLMERQRLALLEQMAQLQNTLQTLDYKCWYYAEAEKRGSTRDLECLAEEDVPEDVRQGWKNVHHA